MRVRNDGSYVTELVNPTEAWSPRSAADAILDLELGQYSYYVQWPDRTTQVTTAEDSGGVYLRTDTDSTPHNDLLDLPH
ncbi:MAG: hypothetical protein JWM85_447 [Acidimicrobiaceae bacterium]|nr:hypothetical protein [Acidimicrobiaceae bacterium]